jgi:enoyl-CoA hydratase
MKTEKNGADQSDQLVRLQLHDGIATLTLDDGQSNLLSPKMLAQINRALDQIEASGCVVVLTGRHKIFSAGFDLKVLKSGVFDALTMLLEGFKLSQRLLSFPRPVVIACNGHAIAMGSFLLLSGDYRIGAKGEYRIAANEVKIGLTMPHSAVALCKQRLTPVHFNRAVLLSEYYDPETAVAAGFLDEVVAEQALLTRALECASHFLELDATAHWRTKLRMRRGLLSSLKRAIRRDRLEFIKLGLSRLFVKRKK